MTRITIKVTGPTASGKTAIAQAITAALSTYGVAVDLRGVTASDFAFGSGELADTLRGRSVILEEVNISRAPRAHLVTGDAPIGDTVAWVLRAQEAISAAGGDPRAVLAHVPSELLEIMIRNHLVLGYEGSKS